MKNSALWSILTASSLVLAGCSGGEDTTPAQSTLCQGGETHVAVVTSLGFARLTMDGSVPGFDLDNKVTKGDDQASCSKEDRLDPEGNPGIDNQVAALLPDVEKVFGDAIDGLIQGAIVNGDLLITLEAEDVTSLQDDGCVGLTVRVAEGKPALGTDGAIEAYQTFDLKKGSDVSHASKAIIKGRELNAGPFLLAVPIAIFDVSFVLHIQDARVRFMREEDGHIHGILGGGVIIEELIEGVRVGAGVEEKVPLIRAVLNGYADLGYDANEGACKHISAALEFKAEPAFLRTPDGMVGASP